jgi:hypothetical protein
MGHVSFAAGRLLLADETKIALIPTDGSEQLQVLVQHGMRGAPKKAIRPKQLRAAVAARRRNGTMTAGKLQLDYDHQVFANLNATGQVAAYLSNNGTGRFDLFLLRIP